MGEPQPAGYDDLLKSILKRKRWELFVDELTTDAKCVVALSPDTMKEQKLSQGMYVFLSSMKGGNTVAVLLEDSTCSNNHIRMNRSLRSNLLVNIGDLVTVCYCPQIKEWPAKLIQFAPITDFVQDITGSLKVLSNAYFNSTVNSIPIPIYKGNRFLIRVAKKEIEFKIMNTDPSPYCYVTPTTIFECMGPVTRKKEEKALKSVGYNDIGGCVKQLALIKDLIELSLSQSRLFRAIGGKPPSGILLTGPPGIGKTLIARALANETGAFFFPINGSEIMGKLAGESESNLLKLFEKVKLHAPAILFINDIDAIAPKREDVEVERPVIVSQLLTLMDDLKQRADVIVMAATNRPNSIDSSLGRFYHEVDIGIPDATGRMEILRIHTKNMKLAEDVNLEEMVQQTHDFVGADLAALCTEAVSKQISDLGSNHAERLNTLVVSMKNFRLALDTIRTQPETVDMPNEFEELYRQ